MSLGTKQRLSTFPLPSHPGMLRFIKKRWKKTREPSTPVPLEDPTHQITDMGAECGGGSDGECLLGETGAGGTSGADGAAGSDINHRVDSRIPTQDRRIGDRQLPAPNASTLTPGHESGDTREGSAGAQSEQLGRSDPVLPSDEWDSNTRDQREHEDRGPGIQQPSETAAEHTSGGDANGSDLAKPGKSRGKSRCSGTIVHTDRCY